MSEPKRKRVVSFRLISSLLLILGLCLVTSPSQTSFSNEDEVLFSDTFDTFDLSYWAKTSYVSHDPTNKCMILHGTGSGYQANFYERNYNYDRNDYITYQADFKFSENGSNLHLAAEGKGADGTYRRHGIVCRSSDIVVQWNDGSGWQYHTAVNSSQVDTWYTFEVELDQNQSRLYLYLRGTPRPLQPTHIFTKSDWQPRFHAWIYRYTAYVDNFIVCRRIGSTLVSASVVSSQTFEDVAPDHWAYSFIEAGKEAGLFSGYPLPTDPPTFIFMPEQQVDRAQMAGFIAKALRLPLYTGDQIFDDVPPDYWAFGYIGAVWVAGIVHGYNPTTYGPENIVTRDQMAVFLTRARKLDTSSYDPTAPETWAANFLDVSPGPPTSKEPIHWAWKEIQAIAGAKIAFGYNPTTYGPSNPVTRDQMAVFLCRAFNVQVFNPDKITSTVTSSSETAPYYDDNTIDEDISTYWQGASNSSPWWLTYHLGSSYNLSYITIYWDKDYSSTNYDLEISDDGSSWTTVYSDLSTPASTTNPVKVVLELTGRTARYIRIYIKTATSSSPIVYDVYICGYKITDTTLPTISISSPANDAVLSNTIPIQVDATDNVSVMKVEFYIDDELVLTDPAADPDGLFTYSWDTIEVDDDSGERIYPDGPYTITTTAYDTSYWAKSTSINVEVDNTPPSISITSPQDGALVKGLVPIAAELSNEADISKVEFYIDDTLKAIDTHSPWLWDWDTTAYQDGAHTIKVVAYDDAENTGSDEITVTVDNTPPSTPVLLLPSNGSFTNDDTPTFDWNDATDNLSGISSYRLEIDDASDFVNPVLIKSNLISSEYTLTQAEALPDGSYYWRVKAIDGATNEGGFQTPYSFTLDTVVPVVVITSPPDGALFNYSPITLEGTVDGRPFSEERTLTEGENTLTKEATDEAGNTGSASITVTLDTVPPVVVITSPPDGWVTNQSAITLEGTVDGKPFSEPRSLVEGPNTLTKVATDQAGNQGSASIVVTLDTLPPIIHITSPADSSTISSSPISVSGTIDDGSAQVTVNGFQALVEMGTFTASGITLSEGENIITAVAKDPVGNIGIDTITVTLLDTAPPSPPTIDSVITPTNVDSQTITGTNSVDTAQIVITCPTATVGQVNYPTSTSWSCELTNLSEGANIISAVAKDTSENVSGPVSTTIFLDTVGPKLSSTARVVDEKNIEITYNEGVIGGAKDGNYSINPSLGTISAWSRGGNVYRLTTAGQSAAGISYTVTVKNITDLMGNPIDPNYDTATFVGTTLASPTLLVWMEGESDDINFGCSVASAGDVNGDGWDDFIVGSKGWCDPARVYIYFGGPDMDDIADVFIEYERLTNFGCSVASAGDVNGDGYDDVIVGADRAKNENLDWPEDETGKAIIYFGGLSMDNVADVIMVGEAHHDSFGYSVASAGDINGDGYDDVIIGAPLKFRGPRPAKAYIYFGGPSMDNVADVILEGETIGDPFGDFFGYSVASAGDVNGDGYNDVIVGAYDAENVDGLASGRAYIYFGGPSMDEVADVTIDGVSYDDFGYSVASAGDINNDGFSDVIIGAPDAHVWRNGSYSKGRAYIYFGGPSMDDVADLIMDSERDLWDRFGSSVASAGDVNNDGFPDVIVGAPGFHKYLIWERGDGTYIGYGQIGKAYIYLGGPSMDNTADVTIVREVRGNLGCSVASAGDLNGDGFDEFIIGANELNNGEAYVYTLAPIPPRLSSLAKVIDGENVEVGYSEEVAGAGLQANYSIAPTLGAITVSDQGNNTYRLSTEFSHTPGQSYTITVTGVTDVDGIPLDPNYSQATFIGYDPTSIPSVDSFQVFDQDTGSTTHTDSPIVGVTMAESDPDGRIAGWLINESSTRPTASDFVLTAKPANYTIIGGDGSRTIYAWVMDADGNISELSADSQATIVLDTTPPTIEITSPANDSLFSSSPITVSGSVSDITATTVTVNGVEATVWGGRFVANGVGLQQGSNTIAATAQDSVGNTNSDSVVVVLDTTPPSCPTVMDDGKYALSLTQLHASWSSSDLESGIAQYRYAIGTTPGATDVVGWTSVGTATEVTRTGLSLRDRESYYFTVVATNGVGLESDPGTSDGIEATLATVRAWITYPEHGQTIYNDITVTVDATADLGVSKLEFYLDGALQHTDTSFPYEWNWDIAASSPGGHTLKVIACDIMGNIAVDQILVMVAEPDTIPPTVFSVAHVIDQNNVELTYSEEVLGALDPANYLITPSLAIIRVTNQGNNVYRLTTEDQTMWTLYTITVSSVTDLSGNLIDPSANSATFIAGTTGSLVLITSMEGEEDYDKFGWSVASAGDINGDGHSDLIVGARDAKDQNGNRAGKAYIYFGGPSMDDIADVTMDAESDYDDFGCSVASAGDINGDGYDDVIVGASRYSDYGSGLGRGKVYIYFGGPSMDDIADVTLLGEGGYDFFGCSVASAGDVNGDGYDDVIVGAEGYGYGGRYHGKAFVYFGGPSMDGIADVIMVEENYFDKFGYSVASAGDVNGDGFSDLIVGAYDAIGGNGERVGKAYIYFGDPSMDDIADVVMVSEAEYDDFGYSVASAGDVDGDGYDDVIVGSNYWVRGKAYIYFGGPSMDNVADIIMAGEAQSDGFGCSVASAGDVNDDGFSDLIVGAYKAKDGNGDEVGKAYIYFGGPSMDDIVDAVVVGEAEGDDFGYSVASAGDVNNDGFGDVIIGAYEAKNENGINVGKVYLYRLESIPPRLNPQANVIDQNNVEVSYTQNVVGGLIPANYSITPSLGTVTISDRGNSTYRLTTSSAQTPGELYVISVTGITNTAGIPIDQNYNQAIFYGYNGGLDNTPPSTPVVEDDGRKTSSLTTLHASWLSEDPESGIVEYQYGIGSTLVGTEVIRDVVDWTSTGTATGVTRADLNLANNQTYYFVVRAKNGAGLWSKSGMSDGITVSQAPPQIINITPPEGSSFTVGESVSISAEAVEPNGDPIEYQFLIDGVIKRPWGSSPNFSWATGSGDNGSHTIQIEVRDSYGQTSSAERQIHIFRGGVGPPSL